MRETLSQTQSLPAWKEEINAKLTAHRSRRVADTGRQQNLLPGMDALQTAAGERAGRRIAAKVAERYAKAPSYSEMLAQEAAKAARAAAEAAHQAHAAAQAMLQGLELDRAAEMEQAESAQRGWPPPKTAVEEKSEPAMGNRWEEMAAPIVEEPAAPVYRVREESLPPAPRTPAEAYAPGAKRRQEPVPEAVYSAEETQALSLFEDPVEAATIEPAHPLPARVIEFPRELVASRKARPRLEEGPLRTAQEEQSQLRIFEVEPEAISHEPAIEQPVLPEWHSIRLDSEPQADAALLAQEATAAAPELLLDAPIYSASLEDRLMAAMVDTCLVGAGFLAFVATFVACTPHPPTGKLAMAGAGAALLVLFMVYQALFFTFAEGTPGMRYAKIALCTFDDENPTRKAMRQRIVALLLAALPLGLGYLWSFFDEDRLGWHDRMTRTYQRSYREN
jgi:uncharacterized RDD family membrane protein YckC